MCIYTPYFLKVNPTLRFVSLHEALYTDIFIAVFPDSEVTAAFSLHAYQYGGRLGARQ